MGVSRWTVMAIQANDIKIIDTPERCEAWMMHGVHLHALLLSCPLDKRAELEQFIDDVKHNPSLQF